LELSFTAKEGDKVVGFIFAQMVEHLYNMPKIVWAENTGVHASHGRKKRSVSDVEEGYSRGQEEGRQSSAQCDHVRYYEVDHASQETGVFRGRKTALFDLESFR
jgi:aminoglycoside 6'-N-acetyltransferase I